MVSSALLLFKQNSAVLKSRRTESGQTYSKYWDSAEQDLVTVSVSYPSRRTVWGFRLLMDVVHIHNSSPARL